MPPSMPGPAGAGVRNPYVQAQPQIGGLGSGAVMGARPGTGMGAGLNPIGARPGTGMRQPPGSRQGTAGGGPKSFNGIGLNTAVSVEHRPVTQQGMRGSTAAGGRTGPGRQIQDRNYFLGELRAKCTAVEEETDRIKKRAGDTAEENSTYGALERRYETLSNEMRTLQGSLADYNLLLDRSRAGREVADIFDEVAQLKATNGTERAQADGLFTERQNVEAHARQLENALDGHSAALAEKMGALPEQQQELFQNLQAHKSAMLAEMPHRRALLEETLERVAQAEAAVGHDGARAEMAQLREQTRVTGRKVDELTAAAEEVPLTADQQREQLLSTVKRQNAEIASSERTVAESTEACKKHKAQLQLVDAELSKAGVAAQGAANASEAKEAKLEQLQARDIEMQALIDTFEDTRASEELRLAALRGSIVANLTASARAIDASANLGDVDIAAANLTDMRSELAFKSDQTEAAERTAERLVGERERRRAELLKIQSLDSKIAHELAQLADKMAAMSTELVTFRDVNKLKADADARRTYLSSARVSLRARQDAARRAGASRKAAHEEAKADLARDETASSLEALEQKLRHYESSVFQLQEYIHVKERESDFETLKKECQGMLGSINLAAITAARR